MAKVKVYWSENCTYVAVVDLPIETTEGWSEDDLRGLLYDTVVELPKDEFEKAFQSVTAREVDGWDEIEADSVPDIKAPAYEPEW